MNPLFFLNRDPVHVNVDKGDHQYDSAGRKVKTLRRRVWAKFERGIPAWAVPIASETFDWSHFPPDYDPQRAASFYDSEADQIKMDWTDGERSQIEAELQERGYMVVERPRAPLPYPTYAKHRKVQGKRTIDHVIEEVRATLEAAGIDPGSVIAYEVDHLDKDSQAIIDAFAVSSADEEELVVA